MYDSLDKIGLKAVLEAIKGKMPTSLPANGGNADYAANADKLDGLHADDFAKARDSDLMTLLNGQSGDIRALVHQLSNGGYIFDTGYPQLKDIIFPITGAGNLSWSTGIFNMNGYRYGILIVRPMTYNGDTYICSVYNNEVYTDWQKIYTDWNKPYVTGSVTVAANANTAITNHNFMPSAALYLGIANTVRFAPSFTTTSINLTDVQTTERTIEYIIFK